MTECPPGVHSIFDFCPGDCAEPVEDEREHPILEPQPSKREND